MIDNDDRAHPADVPGSGPSDGPKVEARGDQAELTALLGHHRGSPGAVVYTDVHPAARVLAGELAQAAAAGEFERLADALVTGPQLRRAPVLLITDDRESPDGRVVAAVELARQLGRRELRVMLVDADFRALGVGGRLGHDDQLGLVDIARYGASPRPCTQDTGIANVGMLGVGSFRPDEEEPFSDEELRHALAQARGLSDIVLMVAPTRLRDGSFNPLLAYVDGAVLTVAIRHPSADLLESSLGYLSTLEIAVRGVVVYTHPVAAGQPGAAQDASDSPRETQDLAASSVDAAAAAAAPRLPFQRVRDAADEAQRAEPGTMVAPVGTQGAPRATAEGALGEPSARPPLEATYDSEAGDEERSPTAHAERSSSPIFRLLTLALLVLVLGFGGWWALVQRSQQALEPLQTAAPGAASRELRGEAGAVPRPPEATGAAAARTPGSVPGTEPAGEIPGSPASQAGVVQPDEPKAAPPQTGAVATRPPDPEEAFPEDEIPGNAGANALPRTTSPAAAPVATQAEPAAPAPASAAAASVAPAQVPGDEGADTAALRKRLEAPVASGYSLHVWSFPDSLEAVAAGAPLARQGLSPAVRGALIQQRRWYRVLVGSFASRAEAMAARALLAGQPGIDYVGVVRVQP